MAKGTLFQSQILGLILNGTAIPGIADPAASGGLTQLWVAFHTADPTGGAQSLNEIAYPGYARVPVARSASSPAWGLSGLNPAVASPVSPINMPPCMTGGGGPFVATYFSIGSQQTGDGQIYYSGTLSPTLNIETGVTPRLLESSIVSEL